MSGKQDNKLHQFLIAGGAILLDPTNPWEVARFKTPNGTCVIYRNNRGVHRFNNEEANEAYNAFVSKKPWSVLDKQKRTARKKIESLLLERDGDDCFLCGQPMPESDRTLEHLLSIAHGGNNHPANLALMHQECNKLAASLTITEKVKLRDQVRSTA